MNIAEGREQGGSSTTPSSYPETQRQVNGHATPSGSNDAAGDSITIDRETRAITIVVR